MRRLYLVAILLFLCSLPAIASAAPIRQRVTTVSETIPFADFGYVDDVTMTGPEATFSIYIPVYPNLRSARLHLPLRISPVVDPRSAIQVSVNGTPIFAGTVRDRFGADTRSPRHDPARSANLVADHDSGQLVRRW